MPKKDYILNRIGDILKSNDLASELYLFGSQARNDAKINSDWDIIILLEKENIPFELELKIMDELYEIELEEGIVISPLIYSSGYWHNTLSKSSFFQTIRKEGIRII